MNVVAGFSPRCPELLLLDERANLGFPLRVREWTELGCNAPGDRGSLAAGLEAREVRPIAPRQRAAQPHTGLECGVVNDVDRPLVIRRALPITREVTQIPTGCENGCYAWDLGDFVGVLEALEGFDHQDQHNIVVDRLSITARHSTPHRGVERLAAAIAAPSERWKVSPVSRFDCFGEGVYGWHYHN